MGSTAGPAAGEAAHTVRSDTAQSVIQLGYLLAFLAWCWFILAPQFWESWALELEGNDYSAAVESRPITFQFMPGLAVAGLGVGLCIIAMLGRRAVAVRSSGEKFFASPAWKRAFRLALWGPLNFGLFMAVCYLPLAGDRGGWGVMATLPIATAVVTVFAVVVMLEQLRPPPTRTPGDQTLIRFARTTAALVLLLDLCQTGYVVSVFAS